jgi:hypothetical protein
MQNHSRYSDADSMEDAIMNMLFPDARTNTSGGLRHLRQEIFVPARGDRPDVQNKVIVLTDGIPTVEADYTEEEAQKLRDETNVEVTVIGITTQVDKAVLEQISSPPQIENQNWFVTQDFYSLGELISNTTREICPSAAPVSTTLPTTSTSKSIFLLFLTNQTPNTHPLPPLPQCSCFLGILWKLLKILLVNNVD